MNSDSLAKSAPTPTAGGLSGSPLDSGTGTSGASALARRTAAAARSVPPLTVDLFGVKVGVAFHGVDIKQLVMGQKNAKEALGSMLEAYVRDLVMQALHDFDSRTVGQPYNKFYDQVRKAITLLELSLIDFGQEADMESRSKEDLNTRDARMLAFIQSLVLHDDGSVDFSPKPVVQYLQDLQSPKSKRNLASEAVRMASRTPTGQSEEITAERSRLKEASLKPTPSKKERTANSGVRTGDNGLYLSDKQREAILHVAGARTKAEELGKIASLLIDQEGGGTGLEAPVTESVTASLLLVAPSAALGESSGPPSPMPGRGYSISSMMLVNALFERLTPHRAVSTSTSRPVATTTVRGSPDEHKGANRLRKRRIPQQSESRVFGFGTSSAEESEGLLQEPRKSRSTKTVQSSGHKPSPPPATPHTAAVAPPISTSKSTTSPLAARSKVAPLDSDDDSSDAGEEERTPLLGSPSGAAHQKSPSRSQTSTGSASSATTQRQDASHKSLTPAEEDFSDDDEDFSDDEFSDSNGNDSVDDTGPAVMRRGGGPAEDIDHNALQPLLGKENPRDKHR